MYKYKCTEISTQETNTKWVYLIHDRNTIKKISLMNTMSHIKIFHLIIIGVWKSKLQDSDFWDHNLMNTT
jgi:hypothetical protein